jgi:membrane protein DedA with SNARE-associated domain
MEAPESKEGNQDRKEPFDMELVLFFVKIVRTLFLGALWMLINVFLGLFLGFAIPEESTPGRMIFFYSWFTLSLIAYVYIIWRWWRKKMPPP